MNILSWNDVNALVEKVVDELAGNIQFKYIYGIPRGGLVLAVMLSHRLNLEFIQKLPTNYPEELFDEILVVDDIIDKGETAKEYMEKGVKNFVCLHYKASSNIPIVFCPQIKTDDEWILYPWESIESKQEATRKKYE